jgi:hypothetical protein
MTGWTKALLVGAIISIVYQLVVPLETREDIRIGLAASVIAIAVSIGLAVAVRRAGQVGHNWSGYLAIVFFGCMGLAGLGMNMCRLLMQ